MARAREQQRGARDLVADIGAAISLLDRAVDRRAEDDMILETFTVQTHYKRGTGWLVVARFNCGGQRMVAFHGADTGWEALKGFASKLNNNQLRLKEDEYA